MEKRKYHCIKVPCKIISLMLLQLWLVQDPDKTHQGRRAAIIDIWLHRDQTRSWICHPSQSSIQTSADSPPFLCFLTSANSAPFNPYYLQLSSKIPIISILINCIHCFHYFLNLHVWHLMSLEITNPMPATFFFFPQAVAS